MELLLHPYGSVKLSEGKIPFPSHLSLPGADPYHTTSNIGQILVEHCNHDAFQLIYSEIRPTRHFTIQQWLPLNHLASLLILKGSCLINSRKALVAIEQGEFALFRPAPKSLDLTFLPANNIALLFTVYRHNDYTPWLRMIKEAATWLQGKPLKPGFTSPRLAQYGVLNAIHDIFTEKHQHEIRYSLWHLKLQQSLLMQLEDVFIPSSKNPLTATERELAKNIKNLIEKDIARHLTIEELSLLLNASESSLKRAFQSAYSTGIYEYLIRLRMAKAKELLLQGQMVKTVAISLGMRPSNFTSEFRKFYGFNASRLLK